MSPRRSRSTHPLPLVLDDSSSGAQVANASTNRRSHRGRCKLSNSPSSNRRTRHRWCRSPRRSASRPPHGRRRPTSSTRSSTRPERPTPTQRRHGSPPPPEPEPAAKPATPGTDAPTRADADEPKAEWDSRSATRRRHDRVGREPRAERAARRRETTGPAPAASADTAAQPTQGEATPGEAKPVRTTSGPLGDQRAIARSGQRGSRNAATRDRRPEVVAAKVVAGEPGRPQPGATATSRVAAPGRRQPATARAADGRVATSAAAGAVARVEAARTARRATTSSCSTRRTPGSSQQRADRCRGLPRHPRRGLRLPARQRLPRRASRTRTSRQAGPPVRPAQGRPRHRQGRGPQAATRRTPALLEIYTVNGGDPEAAKKRPHFES